MTALANIQAGGRVPASMLAAVAPEAAYKSTDQPVTNSTTLVNDNALFIPVLANAVYRFDCFLKYEGGVSPADLKFAFTGPTGFAMNYELFGLAAGGSSALGFVRAAAGSTAGTTGAGNIWGMTMLGTVTTSSTAGTLQLQWAQNTSNGVATIVHGGSILSLWQVQ